MRKTEMAFLTTHNSDNKKEPSKMVRKIFLQDLNELVICTLCNGYLIDATSLIECHHTFCRGCILRYFEICKTACPLCNTTYKKKSLKFSSDPQMQALVYKLIPGLYSKEMQRREDFYRSTGVRASSSCSDDSVLERERDLINDEEHNNVISSVHHVGKGQFFGPEDTISLSLEYYQERLDDTPLLMDKNKVLMKNVKNISDENLCNNSNNSASVLLNNNNNNNNNDNKVIGVERDNTSSSCPNENEGDGCGLKRLCADKKFLQCPAAVCMKHLQKFVRMKYALTVNHRVDIIYKGEVLPLHFSLMDVAYSFKWKRAKPLRFFYRIFTPLKIQPIKIINTTLSTGGKQLQIVPAKLTPPPPPKFIVPAPPPPLVLEEISKKETEEKERLLAHLQLQSKAKAHQVVPVSKVETKVQSVTKPPTPSECVFEYEEPDKEEIKRFAETRDREWAMQKRLDERRDKDRGDDYHHISKKRKKNKHSKSEFVYKKRKLHAEITNKEEELKLKVKLTHNNTHKHKHHKSSTQELSSKEKLLQMRQVRHKASASEDKDVQTDIKIKTPSPPPPIIEKIPTPPPPPPPVVVVVNNGVNNKVEPSSDLKTVVKSNKEWGGRVPTVQIERNEQTEQQAKKTVNKSFQAYAEKYQLAKKLDTVKSSQLERKIANLQQRCTIEAKTQEKVVKVAKPLYPPGFTVSKIENGTKRKIDSIESGTKEKRPSLEITLIPPPPIVATPVKRPPPLPIPLERIKNKALSFKSGVSIIPKEVPPVINIGPLDLSSRPISPKETKSANLSNLQMLSKVATEHPSLTSKPSPVVTITKPRPPIPNLQTLKIPSLLASTTNKQLPRLNEIPKPHQFRPIIRNLRPNQNQNIRNIPNPSLLVRQQNQNRLNSLNPVPNLVVPVPLPPPPELVVVPKEPIKVTKEPSEEVKKEEAT